MKKIIMMFGCCILLSMLIACGKTHKHNFILETVDATCTKEGYTEYTCETCDYSYRDMFVAASGHNFSDTVYESTCVEAGYTIRHCNNCGIEEIKNVEDPCEHTFNDWIVVKEATCEKEGLKHRTCKVCEKTENEILPHLGHDFIVDKTEPTCDENGFTKYTCKTCGLECFDTVVAALGHELKDSIIEPTCESKGYTKHQCESCGLEYYDTIVAALGHEFKDSVIEPTCESKGYTRHQCENCGLVLYDTIVAALDHDYEDFIVESTCQSEGYTLHTCKTCGDSYEDTYTVMVDCDYVPSAINTVARIANGVNTYACRWCDDFKLDVPVIKVNTNNVEVVSKEEYVSATVIMENCKEGYSFENVTAGIRRRGNSTYDADKKPYRLKFDKKINLLGLNNGTKFKSWVLLALYYDYSLSRDYLSFFIAKKMNFYSSDCTFIELYLNDTYLGVYLLCEQQQINNGRIDIEEYDPLTSDPIDTGYLLEQDWEDRIEAPYIECSYGTNQYFFNVKNDLLSDEQKEYIQSYMQNVITAIYENDRETLEALVDLNSLIEMNLMQLISSDGDPNTSFYIYKDKNSKMVFGAPWDDDWAYGNDLYHTTPNEVSANELFVQLMSYNWYKELLKNKWQEIYDRNLENELMEIIDFLCIAYKDAVDRNYEQYPIWGTKTYRFQNDYVLTFTCWEDAMVWLKTWIMWHFKYINNVYFAEITVEE